MKILDLLNQFDSKYPFKLAADFDNVGLLIGDATTEITKVLTTLDVDLEVCIEAVENGCNTIVSHHPLFAFDPLKRICFDSVNGKLVKYVIENNLNIIAMHTNVDNMNGEVSKWIAEEIGLSVSSSLFIDGEVETGVVCSFTDTYSSLITQIKKTYPKIR